MLVLYVVLWWVVGGGWWVVGGGWWVVVVVMLPWCRGDGAALPGGLGPAAAAPAERARARRGGRGTQAANSNRRGMPPTQQQARQGERASGRTRRVARGVQKLLEPLARAVVDAVGAQHVQSVQIQVGLDRAQRLDLFVRSCVYLCVQLVVCS